MPARQLTPARRSAAVVLGTSLSVMAVLPVHAGGVSITSYGHSVDCP